MSVMVVIRSQICIFDLLNTAKGRGPGGVPCCDSLSNLYLWLIKYSLATYTDKKDNVVIRSQICIFDLLNTA